MSNKAFWRALHSLAHPVSLGAVLLLLLNDHFLRHQYPSWLTGKLGDFAWLVFASFICAAIFAWLVPRRIPQHEAVVGGLSFAFIGLWFALAKTIPAVLALTLTLLEAITGWHGILYVDPTDLLTLPTLLVAWHIWQHADNQPPTLSPRVCAVLALGIFATLANMGPYYGTNLGVSSVCQRDSRLVTVTPGEDRTETDIFTSNDGGLTWSVEHRKNYEDSKQGCSTATNLLIDPTDERIQYRWKAGERIERTADGGQTWMLEYDLFELRQDVRVHYNHQNSVGFFSTSHDFEPGPLNGLIDPKTGNVVLAMSWDGVIVRTHDGEWHWAAVGQYGLANIYTLSRIADILFFELWLAGALGFLVATTAAVYIRRSWVLTTLLFVGWAGWLVLTAIFLLPYHLGEDFSIGLISLPLLIFIATPLSVWALRSLMRNFRHVLPNILLVSIGAALLYLFPFVLWTQGTIPSYRNALIFSLILTMLGLVSGYFYLRRILSIIQRKLESKSSTADSDL
jgi:hypothetical protein